MLWPPLTQASLERSNGAPATSQVYFIANERTLHIKIGRATNPVARLSALQIGSIDPLLLVGVLAGGRDLERELHNAFKAYRERGEWFRGNRLLSQLIMAAYEAGTGTRWGEVYEPVVVRGDPLAVDGLTPQINATSRADVERWCSSLADVMGITVPQARTYVEARRVSS